jgi:hypothetical protein
MVMTQGLVRAVETVLVTERRPSGVPESTGNAYIPGLPNAEGNRSGFRANLDRAAPTLPLTPRLRRREGGMMGLDLGWRHVAGRRVPAPAMADQLDGIEDSLLQLAKRPPCRSMSELVREGREEARPATALSRPFPWRLMLPSLPISRIACRA